MLAIEPRVEPVLDDQRYGAREACRDGDHLVAGLKSFAVKTDAIIVAEGIETAAETKALMGLNIRYGQGFFLGRPSPLPLPARKQRAAVKLSSK